MVEHMPALTSTAVPHTPTITTKSNCMAHEALTCFQGGIVCQCVALIYYVVPQKLQGGYYCNQCLLQSTKVTGEANFPTGTSVVQECIEFRTDEANEGADTKAILAYRASTKVGPSKDTPKGTSGAPKDDPVKFGCYPPTIFKESTGNTSVNIK